jgi:type II secretory ATPase GspE/PulE/Tfp pilus assembly ATPase PilB-like protein
LYSRGGLDFEGLGLRPELYQLLEEEICRPNGLLLTTGPTGSGKTSTLYAVLLKLKSPETKIITIEDPIEYNLAGITQSQTDEKRGHTFAKALRSVVRQDPDIILVGEIRDLETVEVAVQAALTGHFVLSTVHTNSAAAAIPRLISLGIKSFLLAPALNVVMGQRLVRRLCPACKKEAKLTIPQLEKVKQFLVGLPQNYQDKFNLTQPEQLKFFESKGCDKCQGIGYKGRIGIFEIMKVNNEIRELILAKDVPEHQIFQAAVKNGLITMAQDGVLRAAEGITSLEEVFRVAQ